MGLRLGSKQVYVKKNTQKTQKNILPLYNFCFLHKSVDRNNGMMNLEGSLNVFKSDTRF
jgi:hypothetical protein